MQAMRLLPQGKQLNIRLGILLAVVGLVVTTVSFSGTYAYDLRFFYLAIVGSVLSLYGMVLLANSRVVSERRTQRRRQTAGAPREWVRLQCPRCGTVFEEEGARPFQAVCPSCKASGLIA